MGSICVIFELWLLEMHVFLASKHLLNKVVYVVVTVIIIIIIVFLEFRMTVVLQLKLAVLW